MRSLLLGTLLAFTVGCGGITGLGGAGSKSDGDEGNGDEPSSEEKTTEKSEAVVPTDVAGSFLSCGPEAEGLYGCGFFDAAGAKSAYQPEIRRVALTCSAPSSPSLRTPGATSRWQKLFEVPAACAATITKIDVNYDGADGQEKTGAVRAIPGEKAPQGQPSPGPSPAPVTGARFEVSKKIASSLPGVLPCASLTQGIGLLAATTACDTACSASEVGRFLRCEADGSLTCACLQAAEGAAEKSFAVATSQIGGSPSCDSITSSASPSATRVQANTHCDTGCKQRHDVSTGFMSSCTGTDAVCTCLADSKNVFETVLSLPTALDPALSCITATEGTKAYEADIACEALCIERKAKVGWMASCSPGVANLSCACAN